MAGQTLLTIRTMKNQNWRIHINASLPLQDQVHIPLQAIAVHWWSPALQAIS